MTIIAARRYRDGAAIAEIDLAVEHREPSHEGEFAWIDLLEPDDAELERVGRCFGLHPLAVEDALAKRQLPKIEQYGDQVFLMLRNASLADDRIIHGQTGIFLGRDFIITVRLGPGRALDGLRAQLESASELLTRGPGFVLHAVVDFIVDGYYPIVEDLEEEALEMESATAGNFLDRSATLRIFEMRREVVRFQRVLGIMTDVIGRLTNLVWPHIDPVLGPYFSDVLDHVRRAEYRLGGLREILTSVVETSNLLEMQRQGENTRRLAAWAAILAVPTAIAGIYGMNFKYMPELDWPHGYLITLGLMIVVCLLLYRRLRMAGWL